MNEWTNKQAWAQCPFPNTVPETRPLQKQYYETEEIDF